MKKMLLMTALLATSITQVQAAPFGKDFIDNAPENSAITITFSGDCSGKVTDTASKIQAGAYDDHWNGKYSYIRFFTTGMNNLMLDDIFYTQTVGNTTSISVNKGVLNVKLSDTSAYRSGWDIQKIHDSGADNQIQCKSSGYTLGQLVSNQGGTMKLVRDKTLKGKTSFTLKGSAAPFNYKLSQKVSGYLFITPSICDITGDSTGDITSDTYKSSCKLQPKIKVSISATASGKAN